MFCSSRQKLYQLKSTVPYFMRHEKRLREYEEKKAAEAANKEAGSKYNDDSCLIS